MKEFLIGLLFIIVVFLLTGLGYVLYPFFLVLAIFLRVILSIGLILFAVWLLGKSIIFVWEKIKEK